jgi:HNH endonuclease
MAKSQRAIVRERAGDRCEYCLIPQSLTSLPHTLDHIRARKHRGLTALANLCWSCAQCNAAKGPNVAGHDPTTDGLVPLFNPRAQSWDDHFAWSDARLIGRTSVGRTTIDVLRMNDANRVAHRAMLMQAGLY